MTMERTPLFWKIREQAPLIHCITNHISIKDCADGILSLGAKPIMAEHPLEAAEITKRASALVLNLGNISESRMKAMLCSAKTAGEQGIPVVLDLVGVGCSSLRRNLTEELLKLCTPAVLKGNRSELFAIMKGTRVPGVDVSKEDASADLEEVISLAAGLSAKTGSAVAVTGREDIVASGNKAAILSNGVEKLSWVTGTGCLSSALTGAFLAVTDGFSAAVAGISSLNICGELADKGQGLRSFQISLMDELSKIDDEAFFARLKIREEKQ